MFLTTSANGSVYIKNINGPNTEHCGTPIFVPRDSDVASSITTDCDRPNKYHLNQRNALPVTPTQFSRRLINIE